MKTAKKFWLILWFILASAFVPAQAQAQQVFDPKQDAIACAYNTSLPTLTSGWYGLVQCDSTGHLLVSATLSASISGFAPSGNFVGPITAPSGSSSAATAIPAGSPTTIIFYNTGSYPVSVNLGNSAVTATANNNIIQSGSWLALSPGSNADFAVYGIGGASTVLAAGGSGLPTGTSGGSSGGGGTVTQGPAASSGPWIETPWIAGAVNSATNGLYINLLQGNVALSAGNPIFATIEGVVPLPTGAATSANQTNAAQKTQIVDGSGNVIASTSNNLNVQCANCSGSGVSTTDEAAYIAGTSLFAGGGGFYQTTPTVGALTNGQQGLFQLTAQRALFTNLRNSSGTEIATSSNPLITTPYIAGAVNSATNGTYSDLLQNNTVLSATNGLFSNILQGNAALTGANPIFAAPTIAGAVNSATNGLYVNLLQGNTALSAGNPIFATLEGTVPLPTGAATSALQPTSEAFAGTSSTGTTGTTAFGASTTSAPTYTTGSNWPLSLTPVGNLRVDGSSVTQPISGSVTVSGTSTVTQGTAAASNPWIFTPWIAGAVNSATNGTYSDLLQGNAVLSATNGLFSNILQGNAVLTAANPIFSALSIGGGVISATNGLYTNLLQGNAAIASGNPIFAQLTAGTTTIGNVNQTLATAGFAKITDGTNTAAVKAASTAAATTDPAVVVSVSPNSPITAANNPVGSAALATTQASVGTSATLIIAARTGVTGTGRIAVTVYNYGTATVFIGTSGVTTSTGLPLLIGASMTINTTAAVYGISGTAAQTIGVMETF